MKERPIIFTAPMVRAILAGRKTMTRRLAKLPVVGEFTEDGSLRLRCPFGQPGERLWVREKWGYFDPDGGSADVEDRGPPAPFCGEMMQEGHPLRDFWRRRIAYAATWQMPRYGCGPDAPARWRSPIHMPRWASRITLEIESVRVERLQDISSDDCVAEGVGDPVGTPLPYGSVTEAWNRRSYQLRWETINGPDSWTANPWVWVLSFKRVTP